MGNPVTSSERLGPVKRSDGRIAVLARRPPENRDVFCDFVASMGREGPLSILATLGERGGGLAPKGRALQLLGSCSAVPGTP